MPVSKTSYSKQYNHIIVINQLVKFINFSLVHLHMSYTLLIMSTGKQ
jgi:hypothetical protein